MSYSILTFLKFRSFLSAPVTIMDEWLQVGDLLVIGGMTKIFLDLDVEINGVTNIQFKLVKYSTKNSDMCIDTATTNKIKFRSAILEMDEDVDKKFVRPVEVFPGCTYCLMAKADTIGARLLTADYGTGAY